MHLRCSSLPIFMKCGQSMRGAVSVNEWYPESTLGTAAHAAMARHISGMPVDIEALARLYGVEEGELGYLFSQGRKAWEEIAPLVADSPVYVERKLAVTVGDDSLTGSADVIIEHDGGRVVEVIDWKTGRRDSDHREQVLGYCQLVLQNAAAVEVATARVVWLRNLETEVYSLRRSEAEMDAHLGRFHAQVEDTAYRPGQHCQYCPRKFECPARIDMSTAALAVLGGERGKELRLMPPEEQVALYRKAKDVLDLAYRVIDQVKALANEAPIVGGGVRLEMVEEARRALKPSEAWPVLQRHLTDDALAEAVSVSVTKVQDAVAIGAPRGQGAGRKRELMAELEAAGAVTTSTVKKLSERRA